MASHREIIAVMLMLILFPLVHCEFMAASLNTDDAIYPSADEKIEEMIAGDQDLLNDLNFQTQSLSYLFGEESENQHNTSSMEDVINMIYEDKDDEETPGFHKNSSVLLADKTDKDDKGSARKTRKPATRKKLLRRLGKILKSYGCDSKYWEDSLIIIKKDNSGKNKIVLQITESDGPDLKAITKEFPLLTQKDIPKIEDIIDEYSNLYSIKTSNDFGSTKNPPRRIDSDISFTIFDLEQFVNDGIVEKQVLLDVKQGRTSVDEASMNLLQNRSFVLSHFPPKLEDMLDSNRLSDEAEEVLFSAKYSLDDLKRKIYSYNDISKALLPESIRQILENRSPPQELKEMLYCGYNHSDIEEIAMTNQTIIESMMSDSMFYFFNLFKIPRNVMLNMALSGTTIVALTCVMTALGCTMTVKEIMVHVRRPKGVLIALISQYGVMPLTAFGLTQLFGLQVYPAIAVLICGCCPGGNLSNILAFAINGDMNLSILMTTCSSVLGLAVMPLLLYCYSRFIIPIDGSEIVPFDKIILNIALTIIPVSIGIAIKHYRESWTKHVMRFGAVMLLLCTITFSIIAAFLLGDKVFSYFPIQVVYCAAILPITGYILGFILARLVRENLRCSRTISVETGCQNVQLCGTVLKLAFDPVLIGAMMLLPIIYMIFQAGEALLLITLYRFYERCFGKKKKSDEDSELKYDDDDDDDEKNGSIDSEKKELGNGNAKKNREHWPLMSNGFRGSLEKSKENNV